MHKGRRPLAIILVALVADKPSQWRLGLKGCYATAIEFMQTDIQQNKERVKKALFPMPVTFHACVITTGCLRQFCLFM